MSWRQSWTQSHPLVTTWQVPPGHLGLHASMEDWGDGCQIGIPAGKIDLYGEPSAEMRRLLKEIIGLLEHQVMQMTKPAIRDVRDPQQGNETADRAITKKVGFLKHALDGCLYLSTRLAHKEDDPFRMFKLNGKDYAVDGILLGLHVDDIIAAGEFFHKAEDAVEPQGEPQNFAERVHMLLHRF